MPRPRLYLRGRTWWCWGYYPDGRRWHASTHQRDERTAEHAARRIELQRSAGPPDRAPPLPLKTALRRLLAADDLAGRSAATIEIHTTKGRHLQRVLGSRYDVRSVTADVLAAYAAQRVAEGASRHTARKELDVLRQAMRICGLTWDPRLMPDLGRVYVPRKRWLPVAEYQRLLAALPPHRRPYVVMWCHTGMRESELYRLAGRHVDHAAGLIHVPGTKTAAAARTVPMNASARAVLALRKGCDPLFPAWPNCQRDLAAACARAEIERASPNDLRRTFTSWLANAGVSPLVAAKLLGHTSTRMVEQVYAHLGAGIQRDAVDALPQLAAVTSDVTERADSEDTPDVSDGSR